MGMLKDLEPQLVTLSLIRDSTTVHNLYTHTCGNTSYKPNDGRLGVSP